MKEAVAEIRSHFIRSADPNLALPMKAYMKNKFEFFGIKSPDRKALSSEVLKSLKSLSKKDTIALAKLLWNEPQRELHYFAMELLLQNLKKQITKDDIDWMEWFITRQSWWDSVDFIAPKLLGIYFQNFPEERKLKTDAWIKSGHTWLIRSALLFQLKYKDKTDLRMAFDIILRTCHTKEFFINKAIGWLLRENAKTRPSEIQQFVSTHQHKLHNLSVREALKNLD